jgi:hypothetical protein
VKCCANPSCGEPLPDGYRGNYCDNNNRCKQAAYNERKRQAAQANGDALLARLADITTEWARAGADGWEALEVAVRPTRELLERLA